MVESSRFLQLEQLLRLLTAAMAEAGRKGEAALYGHGRHNPRLYTGSGTHGVAVDGCRETEPIDVQRPS